VHPRRPGEGHRAAEPRHGRAPEVLQLLRRREGRGGRQGRVDSRVTMTRAGTPVPRRRAGVPDLHSTVPGGPRLFSVPGPADAAPEPRIPAMRRTCQRTRPPVPPPATRSLASQHHPGDHPGVRNRHDCARLRARGRRRRCRRGGPIIPLAHLDSMRRMSVTSWGSTLRRCHLASVLHGQSQ
jgi:hypothetical protein